MILLPILVDLYHHVVNAPYDHCHLPVQFIFINTIRYCLVSPPLNKFVQVHHKICILLLDLIMFCLAELGHGTHLSS